MVSDAQGYMAGADERATLIVQIESVEAVRNLDGILTTPGIDAVFAGPNDLAFSTLKPGESFTKPSGAEGDGANSWTTFARNPETAALCEEIYTKAKAKSMPFGMTSGSIEEARSWLKRGASLMTFGSDFLFMRDGAGHLCEPPEPESRAGAIDQLVSPALSRDFDDNYLSAKEALEPYAKLSGSSAATCRHGGWRSVSGAERDASLESIRVRIHWHRW